MVFGRDHYFTEFTVGKGIFYAITVLYVCSSSVIVLLEPLIPLPCNANQLSKFQYENPSYMDDPCRHTRMIRLLFLTPDECDFGRRLVAAVILGGIIGWERRQADRPAGIRTMALVALGSCLFTICSAFAFLSGPMAWDASRISAAIPSGVGFLGAGLIFKQAEKKHEKSGEESTQHVVLGLTTATSLWLSAAVGVACGGELYFVASFATAILLMLLRFGPRIRPDHADDIHTMVQIRSSVIPLYSGGTSDATKGLRDNGDDDKRGVDPETQPMLQRPGHAVSNSMRQRAQLAQLSHVL